MLWTGEGAACRIRDGRRKDLVLSKRNLTMAIAAGLLLLGACGKSISTQTPAALTERDFAADPALRLEPEQVGVTFLEPVDASSSEEPDTDGLGQDGIPLRITEAATYTYGLDPEDTSGTIARAELRRTDGTRLFTLTPASPSASLTLAPGDYELFVFSGFTKAQMPGGGEATLFLSDAVATSPAATLGPTMPRVKQADLSKLLRVNYCMRCDLTGASLKGAKLERAGLASANLTGADLSGANLFSASLTSVNLTAATLTDADLTSASMKNANLADANAERANFTNAYLADATLPRAILNGATLTGAIMPRASLKGAKLAGAKLYATGLRSADLSGADLSRAVLMAADLTGADLTGAILVGADLTTATWTDGRVCAPESVGTCK